MKKKIKKLKSFQEFPTIIEILQKIDVLIEDEKVGILEIANLIEKDPALTTKLLKLANSPFYGFPKRITNVKTALNILGVNVVKMLIIINRFLELSSKEDLLFWEHFVGVGIASQLLAKKLGWEDLSTFYTLGLIHDLGLLVEKLSFPKEFEKIKERIKEGQSLVEAEKEILKFDHCELGAYLMKDWNFPEKIIEPILAHHELKKSTKYLKESALLYLGDLLVWARGIGNDFFFKKQTLNLEVFSILDLDLKEIKEIFSQMDLLMLEMKVFIDFLLNYKSFKE